MPTSIEGRSPAPRGRGCHAAALAGLAMAVGGCGGEPPEGEVRNSRAFEALLSAVAMKDGKELEKDARVIDERRASGELSGGSYEILREIIGKARAKDWGGAERRAYEFRARFGDRGSYFK